MGEREERGTTKGGSVGPYGRRRRKEMRSGGGTRIGQMKLNVAETGETKCRYQPVACFNWANMAPLAQMACGYASQADIKHQTASLFVLFPPGCC